MKQKILIIDDDEKLQELLKEYLTEYGFEVDRDLNGQKAIVSISTSKPDIVLLDIMLPGKDGIEILSEIRKIFSVPVIMLTARGEDTDRIFGLEMGADDYLPKPFNPRELLARIKALLRRIDMDTSVEGDNGNDEHVIQKGDIILNRARQSLQIKSKESILSSTEFRIMEAFMKNPNVALSRDQLMNLARGRDHLAYDRSIDVHISKLRQVLDDLDNAGKRIKTIWGTGYMFSLEH